MKQFRKLVSLLFVFVLVLALAAPGSAKGVVAKQDEPNGKKGDNLKHPLGAKQFGLRQQALELKAKGKASGRVHEVAKGQYVELEQTRNDRIFVIIAEFGDQINPTYGGTPGPLHNQIAQPDRAVDNSTIWQADYNREHYVDMYFNKMLAYYQSQSSGRYAFNGDVTEWVKVPFNEANYGSNYCGDNVCARTWLLIRDAINIWTANQLAAGKTAAEVKAYLDTFDVWDRYDYDLDGNFDEPDGYIDHFQIVHAGEGEETGGGAQGSDAIWSHRWFAFYNLTGSAGPAYNKAGGLQFGASGMWVGDYTIQPENGGLGVFAHEYAHDLGLPDQYDGGGENGTGFWTIMSSGSYLGDGTVDIGSTPNDFNAWEKFQLGWLTYDVAQAGKSSSHRLGPAEATTKAAQALFVVLPDRERVLELAAPYAGSYAWWSGMGANLDHSMTRTVDVPAVAPVLSMRLNYHIEVDWDYAYVSVSTDGGATWTNLPELSGLTTNDDPNGQNFGNGITGASAGWVPATFDLSAYAGQTVQLRIRYWTDGYVHETGLLVDEISLGSFTDGAEAGDNGWTLDGFTASDGTESSFHFNAYVAEFRQYRGYDKGLETGPYNFGFLNTLPDWVEHFPYQDGLLVSYWDSSMSDNDVSGHPGEGLVLPVDAHPVPLKRADGAIWRNRIQTYDATFGLWPTDALTLHFNSAPNSIPSLPAVPVFNDLNTYWYAENPSNSVIVPKTGTTIEVKNVNAQGSFMEVLVKPAK